MMYDVIIPARNTEKTVGNIVRTFGKHRDIHQVIVVVDADTADATSEVALGAGAAVIYGQQGKGQNIRQALAYAQTTKVILCDSDLSGFTKEHIDTLLEGDQRFVIGVPDFPLTEVLCSPKMTWEWMPRVFETYMWVSGERLVDTHIISNLNLHGYLTEVQINQAYRRMGVEPVFRHLRGLYSPFRMDDTRMSELLRDRMWGEENGIFRR